MKKSRDQKVVKYHEDPSLLTKSVNNTIENGTKDQRRKFLGMLLGVLGVGLLENLLVGKGVCKDVIDAGNGANQ